MINNLVTAMGLLLILAAVLMHPSPLALPIGWLGVVGLLGAAAAEEGDSDE